MNEPQMSPQQAHDTMLVQWMAQAIGITIRGLIAVFPQVGLEKMLILMSAVAGQQIANAYAGDEMSVFKLRKGCRDAFARAMSNEKIAPLAPQANDRTATIGK